MLIIKIKILITAALPKTFLLSLFKAKHVFSFIVVKAYFNIQYSIQKKMKMFYSSSPIHIGS